MTRERETWLVGCEGRENRGDKSDGFVASFAKRLGGKMELFMGAVLF